MKTKLILFALFLLLSITAYAAPGIRISDYPNLSSLTSNKLFVVADPGVATYNTSFGQVTNQFLTSTELSNKVSSIAGSAATSFWYTNAIRGGITNPYNSMFSSTFGTNGQLEISQLYINNNGYRPSVLFWDGVNVGLGQIAWDGTQFIIDDGIQLTSGAFSGNGSGLTNLNVSTFNVKRFGAYGDTKKVTDAVLATTTNFVTSATANFVAADVGKTVYGIETSSGLARLPVCTITQVVSTTAIRVGSNAVGNYSSINLVYGHDDTYAIQLTATNADAAVPKGIVYLPTGGYMFTNQLFSAVYASQPENGAVGMRGDGIYKTVLFPRHGFNMSYQGGMLFRGGNNKEMTVSGMTLDAAYCAFSFPGGAYPFATGGGSRFTLQDFSIENFFTSDGSVAILLSSPQFFLNHVYSVGNQGAIYVDQCGGTFLNCFASNSKEKNVWFVNSKRAYWIGGAVDEGTQSLTVSGSTNINFVGTHLFGGVGVYAVTVDGSSVANFNECLIEGYSGSGNRGGLRVESGGIATLSQCQVAGYGTFPAITNNGTVYDVGGNRFTSGSLVGNGLKAIHAGTIVVPSTSTRAGSIQGADNTVDGIGFNAGNINIGAWANFIGSQGKLRILNTMKVGFSSDPMNNDNDLFYSRSAAGTFLFDTNIIAKGYIEATNFFQLPTNYVAANFTPIAGKVIIVSSNGSIFSVTQQSTNLIAGP